MKRLLLAAITALSCANVLAVTDTNRTITKIGVQGDDAYFTVSPATSVTCGYGVLYLKDTDNANTKVKVAAVMSAYSDQAPLTRIDYTVVAGSPSTCHVSLVER